MLALGLGIAGAYVAGAVLAALLSLSNGGSAWAPMHLALAGAGTVAIGAFMPHFAITLAGTRPGPPWERLVAIGLLAGGVAIVIAGVLVLRGGWALAGALLVIGGLGLVARHTFAPLRDPLARRHPVVTATYGVALLEFAAGVLLGGLATAGLPWIADNWAWLRPAHAWLTLFGAMSVTIFGTLVYLAPTVLGARIRASRALVVAATGILAGPLVAALGFTLHADGLASAGMAVAAVGAIGQVGYVADVVRRRGRYTSEHDWRRVAVAHLVAGTGWFAAALIVALALAAADVTAARSLAGWSIGPLVIPLVAGWMLQELVGSWTHLVPSVTPGDAARHAAQRRLLAILSRSRLAAWNLGIAAAWVGIVLAWPPLAALGAGLIGAAVLLSVILLGRALVARG